MKLSNQWIMPLVVIALGLMGVSFYYLVAVRRSPSARSADANTPIPTPTAKAARISALGRLEPENGLIRVSAPSAPLGASSRVERLLIRENSLVRKGQVIAELDSVDRLRAAVSQAQAGVREAQARLDQVLAGAKQGEIAAQTAVVNQAQSELQGTIATQEAALARLEAEIRFAVAEDQRYQALYTSGAISQSLRDAKRLDLERLQEQRREVAASLARNKATLAAQIQQAESTLASVAEVRPTDIAQAEAQVAVAMANLQRAEAELETAIVRSPIDGQVIKIHAEAGELVGEMGIAELGKTDRMYVVAEVYETDVKRVQPGQRARITSPAFSGALGGRVERVGLQVSKNDVLNTDPAADTDTRVVEVRIRLDESDRVAGLTNLQVNVEIDP